MTKHIANTLTGIRILGSILLLFLSTLTIEFYITYIVCGLTDMLDGTVARITKSASKFGEKFDTAADFVFIVVALIKLLPIIDAPLWMFIWGVAISIIKISVVVWRYISTRQFITQHTTMNKITGLLLFLLPFTLSFIELKYSAIVVCCIASLSAIQEFHIATGIESEQNKFI